MNNKGQSLVVFILLLPIMIVLIGLVFDLGSLMITKNKYENEIKDTIKYGLGHITDEDIVQKMHTLLNSNIEGDKDVSVENNIIRVHVISGKNSLFSSIFNNRYDIDLTYTGYNDNGKMKIIKN